MSRHVCFCCLLFNNFFQHFLPQKKNDSQKQEWTVVSLKCFLPLFISITLFFREPQKIFISFNISLPISVFAFPSTAVRIIEGGTDPLSLRFLSVWTVEGEDPKSQKKKKELQERQIKRFYDIQKQK